MTDQPKPDRPDGDVQAGTIIQIGGAGHHARWGMKAIEVRESTGGLGWRWRPVTSVEKQWLIDALNTRVACDSAEPTPQTILLRQARDYIRQYIKELGGCDHSAGICCCADIELAERIEAVVGDCAAPLPSRDGADSAEKAVARDTERFARLADEPLASIPGGHIAPLDNRTTREIIHDRMKASLAEAQPNHPTLTPPKPARDEMQEALQKIAGYRLPSRGEARYADEVVRMRGIAKAALSAPVPPADGAAEIEAALRFAFPHFEGDEPITAEAIRRVGKEHVDMITGWEPQKDEIEFLDHQGNVHKIVYDPGEDHIGLKIVDLLNGLATPPVRGDRELLEQCAKLAHQFELDMSSSQLDDRDIENIQHGANVASNAIADAILSLPVQPGAGEREAIILECADIAAKYEDCSADFIADKLREFALSRQAPHSSSEGGR